MSNPFTPGFGQTPRFGVGAEVPLRNFEDALDGTQGRGRTVLVAGPRGTGKTVLLNAMSHLAEDHGWTVIPLYTAAGSFTDAVREATVDMLRTMDPDAQRSRWKSGGAGLAGASVNAARDLTDRYEGTPESLSALVGRAAELASAQGPGLMFAVDEVQAVDPNQLRELAQVIQHQLGRGKNIAFAAAGIRSGVQNLLDHDGTTFLRRAQQVVLQSVEPGTAAQAIQQTVAETDKTIDPDAARLAGEISQGYPYLIQLVGDAAWAHAGAADRIEIEDVTATREQVIAEMIRNVHAPALRHLSDRKLDYLMAMTSDNGEPSSTAAIAERLGVDMKYQSVYRDRLIRDDLITAAGAGKVSYALPYLREAVLDKHTGISRYQEAPSRAITRFGPHARSPQARGAAATRERGGAQEC